MNEFPAFSDFFAAVTGSAPFPWQERLAEYTAEHRRFPDAVTVATGLGKTSAMVAHIWALADDVARNGVGGRTYPLRFFHIVERRLVVDAAFDTARAMADKLEAADDTDPVLGPVADALRALVPEPMRGFEPLVATAALHGGRGGIDGDAWLRPVGAVLVCATVTQIASRFMFRGVAVGQNLLPMHAAVVGMDSVIAVDEPHLSVPAINVMRHAAAVQRNGVLIPAGDGTDRPAPQPTVPVSQVVLLGATPPAGVTVESTVGTDAADAAHPVAGRRIAAAKQLRLVKLTKAKKSNAADAADHGDALVAGLASAAADAAKRDLERGEEVDGGTDGVLVFCNTVDLAQQVYAAVSATGTGALLIHGKMRGGDRRIADTGRGIVTVTTQALEVGADYDGFEVITQVCDPSALIQRAGRCNRRGTMAAADVVMVAGSRMDAGTKLVYPNPYGAEHVLTAVLSLAGKKPAPFGPADLGSFIEAVRVAAKGADDPPSRSAVLHSEAARYLAQTDPPSPIDTGALLRGLDADRPLEVRIAWRRDDDLDLIDEVPVADAETVTVTIPALRLLLSQAGSTPGNHEGDGAIEAVFDDTDNGTVPGDKKTYARVDRRVLAQIRVRDGRKWVAPESVYDIAPGDTVVLAASLGGYGETGVDVDERRSVTDISQKVAVAAGRGKFLADGELHSALATAADDAEGGELPETAADSLGLDGDTPVAVLPITWFDSDDTRHVRFVVALGDGGDDPFQPRRCAQLGEHGHQVGTWTAAAAATLPLPGELADALAEAGHRHDDGKADPRFQRFLGATGTAGDTAMAKGRKVSRAVSAIMREQAGLPSGWRHEVASSNGVDDDLVAHLIVSHHRHGRGLITHHDADSDRCGDARISAHAEVFDALNDRFGPWGLALLETVMRWCDHRASAHPWTARQAVAAGAPVKQTTTAPIPSPDRFSDADPAEIVRLPGLSASPMAGPLAAVGLVAVLRRDGYEPRLRFNPDDGCIEVGGSAGIGAAIRSARCDVSVHMRLDDRLKALGVNKGLRVGSGKVPGEVVAAVAEMADTDPLRVLLPDVGATMEKDGRQVLVSLGFSNNGTAFNALFRRASDGQLTEKWHDPLRVVGTDSFFSSSVGNEAIGDFKIRDCGVDSDRFAYPKQVGRLDELVWAITGHLALGWWPGVAGTRNGTLTLPTPTRWTTLAGYRTLVRGGAAGPQRQWRKVLIRQLRVWEEVR